MTDQIPPSSAQTISKRRSGSDNGTSQEESNTEPSCKVYQFVDLSNDDPIVRKQNLTNARSYITKNIRRRKLIEDAKKVKFIMWTPPVVKHKQSQILHTSMNLGPLDFICSPLLSTNIMPTSQRKWSPLSHELIKHQLTDVLAAAYPQTAITEFWESIMRSSSMVIHAQIWASAVHRDQRRQALVETMTREILLHRAAALHLINDEISLVCKGKAPSEQLLLSILATTVETRGQWQPVGRHKPIPHPFRISHMPKGWDFLMVEYNRTHIAGLFDLVARHGGLGALKSRPVAKVIAILDVLIAAMELRAPVEPWVEVDEVAGLVADLSLNVLEAEAQLAPQTELRPERRETRAPGSSLPQLQVLIGTTCLLASVLDRLQRAVAVGYALPRGKLRNINFMALVGESTALHHAIFSVPQEYTAGGPLYEPVRLVTLIFDVGVLFPQPPALGLLGRLVRMARAALEYSGCLEYVHDESAEALIWILFVVGVAATGMPERDWFTERLSWLTHSVEWSDVKELLMSYVWAPDAMDETAMDLWNEVRSYGSLL